MNLVSYLAQHPTAFTEQALVLFRRQAAENKLYAQFLHGIGCKPDRITAWEDIPALPISCFRHHTVSSGLVPDSQTEDPLVFGSSGSTAATVSQHRFPDPARYREAFRAGFTAAYGDPTNWAFLFLLPGYLDRPANSPGSSLVYMCQHLAGWSGFAESGFYLQETQALLDRAHAWKQQAVPTMLLGASFALLDLAEKGPHELGNITVVETGGMKGRRKELVREALHDALCQGLGVSTVHGEYGMTELASQAWSYEQGYYQTPPWMRIRIRDINDPLENAAPGSIGRVDVLDLANEHSCAFVATDDLGRVRPDGRFEILGRFDHADVRGCNLLVA